MHPLIDNLKEQTDKEISDKLTLLHGRLSQSMSMGNRELMDQIQLCIQSYNEEHDKRILKQIEEGAKAAAQEGSGYDFDGLINISK